MRQDVTFDSAGIELAGHLYLPDAVLAGPRPAIVVGHPGSGVKEQAAGVYARRLSAAGFVTLFERHYLPYTACITAVLAALLHQHFGSPDAEEALSLSAVLAKLADGEHVIAGSGKLTH